jgi:DnaK suppressor protein
MRKEELARFKKLLETKRKVLMGDMDTLSREALHRNRQEASGDVSNMPTHMADLGTDNFEQELNLNLIQTEQGTLREIDEALERIDLGTYGQCEGCGKPIPPTRLKALPHARLCLECKRREEY